MELVFVHGWGFTADFWHPVCALLPQFQQRRVDLGFYGRPSDSAAFDKESILIGHSLGFIHGIQHNKARSGWVAINGFARFVGDAARPGCVAATELRGMKTFLSIDSQKTLQGFYKRLGANPPEGSPNIENMRAGLDALRDGDVASDLEALKMPGMVLASRNDPLVPIETSEALGLFAPNGDIMWHETGGHILPLNDSAWCAKAISTFVQKFFG